MVGFGSMWGWFGVGLGFLSAWFRFTVCRRLVFVLVRVGSGFI
jgi:hypothetical protein